MDNAQPNEWQIILIDDEADIREVTSLTLQDAGYRVETASDGLAGLELCHKRSPQIVITDIRMPRMNGLEVLDRIKQAGSDTEVIVVTAFGEMDLAIQALQLDASDFITKPINDESLHLALQRAQERYLARKQVRDYTGLLEKENARTARELSTAIAIQKTLIESALDGIASFSREDRVVTANSSMVRMLSYRNEEEVRQIPLTRLFVPGAAQTFRQKLAGREYGGHDKLLFYDTSLVDAAGKPVPVQLSAVRLAGEIAEIDTICFFRDLREIVNLEREVADQARILHRDKMMSLGRLAASVVHEINNPLAGILNYLRLMKRILKRGPLEANHQSEFVEHLDLVESETDRCSRIVSNLLAFSRKTTPSHEPIDFADLVQRSVVLSQHKLDLSNIAVKYSIAPGLPAVKGDFNQLQQCLINLIFNAIDAMPQGGTLDVSVCKSSDNSGVTIAVKDSGSGISVEDQRHIFEPFFTTKDDGGGVGLGLSTVFGILESHKGTIVVQSAPSQGTTFNLKLPSAT
jgi:signal transduction histidine kinase